MTPDTEWEKELRKEIQMFFYNAEHPEVYSSYEIAMFERKVEGIISLFQNTVSSRDTYWKERVQTVIDENQGDYESKNPEIGWIKAVPVASFITKLNEL